MSIFNLISNTVEGVAQVAVNVVKAPFGVITAPIDDGDTVRDAANGVVEGMKKIGSSEKDRAND